MESKHIHFGDPGVVLGCKSWKHQWSRGQETVGEIWLVFGERGNNVSSVKIVVQVEVENFILNQAFCKR